MCVLIVCKCNLCDKNTEFRCHHMLILKFHCDIFNIGGPVQPSYRILISIK